MSSFDSTFRPVALVTGGASTLGAEISRRLVQKNYRLILHYGGSLKKTQQLEAELKSDWGRYCRFTSEPSKSDRD